jgi:hypothetical protein
MNDRINCERPGLWPGGEKRFGRAAARQAH